jgi:hypothetical protein
MGETMPEVEQVAEGQPVPATPEVAEAATKPAAVSEAAPSELEEQEEKPRGGFQRKIDKLTRDRYQLEGMNRELRDRLGRIEQQLAGKPAGTAKEPDDLRPVVDKFASYEDYMEAVSRWAARQEHKSLAEQSRKRDTEQERADRDKEIFDAFNRRKAVFVREHDDFDDVISSIVMPEAVAQAVQVAIMEEDNGPELAYYLGQHPDVCKQLSELSPARAIVRLGKIAAQLVPESTTEDESDEETPAAPKPQQVASAPAPIRPVKKPVPTATGLSDDLPIDEWVKRREKQLRRE